MCTTEREVHVYVCPECESMCLCETERYVQRVCVECECMCVQNREVRTTCVCVECECMCF